MEPIVDQTAGREFDLVSNFTNGSFYLKRSIVLRSQFLAPRLTVDYLQGALTTPNLQKSCQFCVCQRLDESKHALYSCHTPINSLTRRFSG